MEIINYFFVTFAGANTLIIFEQAFLITLQFVHYFLIEKEEYAKNTNQII